MSSHVFRLIRIQFCTRRHVTRVRTRDRIRAPDSADFQAVLSVFLAEGGGSDGLQGLRPLRRHKEEHQGRLQGHLRRQRYGSGPRVVSRVHCVQGALSCGCYQGALTSRCTHVMRAGCTLESATCCCTDSIQGALTLRSGCTHVLRSCRVHSRVTRCSVQGALRLCSGCTQVVFRVHSGCVQGALTLRSMRTHVLCCLVHSLSDVLLYSSGCVHVGLMMRNPEDRCGYLECVHAEEQRFERGECRLSPPQAAWRALRACVPFHPGESVLTFLHSVW